MAIESHYKTLIDNGLDASGIKLVVTDLLPAYSEVIARIFPNALHQYCVFHFMQLINKQFKEALKVHRYKHFKEGERKEAHKIALLMLKAQEKLSKEEQILVLAFSEKYPDVMADYAMKEDIRTLYMQAKSEIQAVAWKDIVLENYEPIISPTMQKTVKLIQNSFEKTISYLKIGVFHAKTNNDAERIMRKIERNQKIHYFFRTENSLIRHLKIRLGILKIFTP